MASAWVKSLQCKSISPDDVVVKLTKPLTFSGCRKSISTLNDVVVHRRRSVPTTAKKRNPRKSSFSLPMSPAPPTSSFPSLVELPVGYSSRNVVEIIFHTGWPPGVPRARVEMLFKIHNPAKTVTRFEEYRDSVKHRAARLTASDSSARCAADGNEVMRFYCVGPATGACKDDTTGLCTFSRKGGAAIRTFCNSGGAHRSAAAGGKGRRAMLVCRVVAGRICAKVESFLEGFDSVSSEDESLLVFDSRALLPCFLIIYKV